MILSMPNDSIATGVRQWQNELHNYSRKTKNGYCDSYVKITRLHPKTIETMSELNEKHLDLANIQENADCEKEEVCPLKQKIKESKLLCSNGDGINNIHDNEEDLGHTDDNDENVFENEARMEQEKEITVNVNKNNITSNGKKLLTTSLVCNSEETNAGPSGTQINVESKKKQNIKRKRSTDGKEEENNKPKKQNKNALLDENESIKSKSPKKSLSLESITKKYTCSKETQTCSDKKIDQQLEKVINPLNVPPKTEIAVINDAASVRDDMQSFLANLNILKDKMLEEKQHEVKILKKKYDDKVAEIEEKIDVFYKASNSLIKNKNLGITALADIAKAYSLSYIEPVIDSSIVKTEMNANYPVPCEIIEISDEDAPSSNSGVMTAGNDSVLESLLADSSTNSVEKKPAVHSSSNSKSPSPSVSVETNDQNKEKHSTDVIQGRISTIPEANIEIFGSSQTSQPMTNEPMIECSPASSVEKKPSNVSRLLTDIPRNNYLEQNSHLSTQQLDTQTEAQQSEVMSNLAHSSKNNASKLQQLLCVNKASLEGLHGRNSHQQTSKNPQKIHQSLPQPIQKQNDLNIKSQQNSNSSLQQQTILNIPPVQLRSLPQPPPQPLNKPNKDHIQERQGTQSNFTPMQQYPQIYSSSATQQISIQGGQQASQPSQNVLQKHYPSSATLHYRKPSPIRQPLSQPSNNYRQPSLSQPSVNYRPQRHQLPINRPSGPHPPNFRSQIPQNPYCRLPVTQPPSYSPVVPVSQPPNYRHPRSQPPRYNGPQVSQTQNYNYPRSQPPIYGPPQSQLQNCRYPVPQQSNNNLQIPRQTQNAHHSVIIQPQQFGTIPESQRNIQVATGNQQTQNISTAFHQTYQSSHPNVSTNVEHLPPQPFGVNQTKASSSSAGIRVSNSVISVSSKPKNVATTEQLKVQQKLKETHPSLTISSVQQISLTTFKNECCVLCGEDAVLFCCENYYCSNEHRDEDEIHKSECSAKK